MTTYLFFKFNPVLQVYFKIKTSNEISYQTNFKKYEKRNRKAQNKNIIEPTIYIF